MEKNIRINRTSLARLENGKKALVFWLVNRNPIGFDLEKDIDDILDVFETNDTSNILYARVKEDSEGNITSIGHITENKWWDFPDPNVSVAE